MFSQATELVAGGMVMFILLFFLLASGDLFLRKLIRVLPSLADKKRAVEIARQIETGRLHLPGDDHGHQPRPRPGGLGAHDAGSACPTRSSGACWPW